MRTRTENAQQKPERFVKRISVELNPKLHSDMRNLARRRRVQIGLLYEEALREFLAKPENYMGENRSPRRINNQR